MQHSSFWRYYAILQTIIAHKEKQVQHFFSKTKSFDRDVMHLLFALFDFSLVFEVVIDICVAPFCNSPSRKCFGYQIRAKRDDKFIRLRPVHPAVAGGQLADLLLELFGQLGLFQPPAPVLAHGGGLVDAGGVVQPQPVLHGDDAGRCRTA